MRNKEEILQSLDCLLNQESELEERIKETKQELADCLDRQLEESAAEVKRMKKKDKQS